LGGWRKGHIRNLDSSPRFTRNHYHDIQIGKYNPIVFQKGALQCDRNIYIVIQHSLTTQKGETMSNKMLEFVSFRTSEKNKQRITEAAESEFLCPGSFVRSVVLKEIEKRGY